MSGDSYVDCPRCKGFIDKFDAEVKGFLKDYYGKINAEDYEVLRESLKKIKNPFAVGNSVRLDYAASFNKEGEFEFYAHANCEMCGLAARHVGEVRPTNQSHSQDIFKKEIEKLQDKLKLPRPV
jgi:hypothetical protein